MATPEHIFADRDFRSAPRESQRQRLMDFDPEGFGKMSASRQESIIEAGIARIEPDADYVAALERGFMNSIAGAAHMGANLADFMPGGDDLERHFRGVAMDAAEAGESPEDRTTGEMYAEIAGSLPLNLAMAVGATSFAGLGVRGAALAAGASGANAAKAAHILAPILGFGGMGAVGAADQGPKASMHAAMVEGAFGALFPASQHLLRPSRAALIGGVAYAMTPEDMDFEERVGHGVTMALMGGMHGARDPVGPVKWMGKKVGLDIKNPHRIYEFDQKKADELTLRHEMETLAHARDQKRAQKESERTERVDPESLPTTDAEGQGDPSGLGDRGRLKDPEIETRPLIVENGDRQTNSKGEPVVWQSGHWPGANYQSLKQVPYSVDLPVKIVKANDIFHKTAKILGLPAVRGPMPKALENRKHPKGVSGYHMQGQPTGEHYFSGLTRVERFHDVGTNAHEFGHQLSYFGRIQEAMHNSPEAKALYETNPRIEDLPPWLQQLHKMSYEVRDVEEGFAEFVRHWLTNGDYARIHAPDTVAMFENVASRVLSRKQWKNLLKLREQSHKWYDQGAFATATSKFGGEGGPGYEDALHGKMAKQREQNFDDFQGGLELVKILGIEMPDNVYETIRRLRATGSIAEGMRKYGALREVPDPKNPGKFMFEYDGEGWQKIVEPHTGKGAKEWEDLWGYITGKSAEELHHLGLEKLFDPAEIMSLLSLETPQRLQTYNKLKAFRERTADFMEQMGVINKNQRASWRRKEFVFSFWRNLELGKQGRGRTSDMLAANTGVYKIHGSSQSLKDPFFSFVDGIRQQVEVALRNRAMLELVDIGQSTFRVGGSRHYGPRAEGVKGAGAFFSRIDATNDMVTIGTSNVLTALKADLKGLLPRTSDLQLDIVMNWLGKNTQDLAQLSVFMGNSKPFGSHILTVLREGKPEYYEIHDPMLVRTVQAMSRPAQVGLMKQWGALKTLKQQFIVVEPSFMAANFIRDIAMASIMTRTGNQHLTAALNGLIHVWRQDKTYQDFIANGGGGSTMRDNLHITKKRLQQHKGGVVNPGNLMVTFSDVIRGMELIGRGLENASRVGEYARGRRKGMTATHAAYLAREVSTDFSVRGGNTGILGFANTTIPFFSAMLAGADRGYRAMFRDPTGKAKTVLKIGMVGTASAVLHGMNKQLGATFGHLKDEDGKTMVDFNQLPQWAKTAYWHWYIPTEFSPETGEPTSFTHMHMPKLWEVGAIATWAELTVDSMQGGSEDDRSLIKDYLQVAAGNFNLNIIEEGFLFPLPVGVDMLAEQTTNKILFTGSPIETAGMENLQPWQRARSSQTRLMKNWGEMFKGGLGDFTPAFIKSPARAEALVRGLTGQWGNMALEMFDAMKYPGGPTMGISEYPIVRRVYSEAGKYDKNVSGFYDNLKTFNQAYGTLRQMSKQGDIDGMAEMGLDQDQMDMVAMSPGFDKMNRSIQLMNREIGLIRDGVVMSYSTGREKASAINRIEAERNQLMKSMNEFERFYRNR